MKLHSLRAALIAAALGAGMQVQAHAGGDHAASAAARGHHHDHGASIGEAGDPAKVTRTVDVDMTDNMRFTPASVNVRQGETVRFVVKNSGQLQHEFVLGTEHALKEHYELMKKFPEMEHADPNMVTLQPGKTARSSGTSRGPARCSSPVSSRATTTPA